MSGRKSDSQLVKKTVKAIDESLSILQQADKYIHNPILDNQHVAKARELSHKLHKGQLRDDGKTYTSHTDKVAEILSLVTDNPDVISAGFLHDSIEDGKITIAELRSLVGDRVADLVVEVTKKGTNCFPNLKSREALLIKFADRLQNLSDMEGWTPERQQAYMNKSVFWSR